MNIKKDDNPPDYYALFQISPEASHIDIINAYRHAKLTYQQDSLAIYSLFSEQELELIQVQIEDAYSVLSDPEKRRSYDALNLQTDINTSQSPALGKNVITLHKKTAANFCHAEPDHTPGQTSIYSGEALKEIREAKNTTLESIAERTRISKRYLQAIEDEDPENFPETVYLKGYLRQYAREIGLDPAQVVQHYPPLTGQE